MAYDEKLTGRIRLQLANIPFVEKKMFGGVGFLLNGNMACGVNKKDLVVRVDPERHGRPMKGWLLVEADGYKTEKQLSTWVREGIEFDSSLPPK